MSAGDDAVSSRRPRRRALRARVRRPGRGARQGARHVAGAPPRVASLRDETRPLLESSDRSPTTRGGGARGPRRPRSLRPGARFGGGDQRGRVGSGRVARTAFSAPGHQGRRRRDRHVARAPAARQHRRWRARAGRRGRRRRDEASDMVHRRCRHRCRRASATRSARSSDRAPAAGAGERRQGRAGKVRERVDDVGDAVARGPRGDAHPRARAAGPPRRPGRDARRPLGPDAVARRRPTGRDRTGRSSCASRDGERRQARSRRDADGRLTVRSSTTSTPRSAPERVRDGATELSLYRRDASNMEGSTSVVCLPRRPPTCRRACSSPTATVCRSSPADRAPACRVARCRSTVRSSSPPRR